MDTFFESRKHRKERSTKKSDVYIGALSLLNANPRGSFGDFANKTQ